MSVTRRQFIKGALGVGGAVSAASLAAGCGSSVTPGDTDTNGAPGGVTFYFDTGAVRAEGDVATRAEAGIRSVTGRWAYWTSCVVTVKDDVTQKELGKVTLTKASPSGAITGIAGGTKVRVYAALYEGTVKITDGQSAQGTIVSGTNISLPIVLTATKPKLSLVSVTASGSVATIKVKSLDVGAMAPTVVLTDNGTPVVVAPTITGTNTSGYVFTWVLTQADGLHNMVVSATGRSHVSDGNSGVATPLEFSYSITGSGGVEVVISGADAEGGK